MDSLFKLEAVVEAPYLDEFEQLTLWNVASVNPVFMLEILETTTDREQFDRCFEISRTK